MTSVFEVSGAVVAQVLAREHGLAYGEHWGVWYVGERDALLRAGIRTVIIPKMTHRL